ncbi:MAG: WHG domain-containing protein, partial [Actinomycetota bacterium]|nr:WHG domain-containing protein [Actinomycetota bacterium]
GPRPTRRALASVAGLLEQLDEPIDEDLLLRGMTALSAVMGSISLELFGHLHRAVVDYPAYFDQLVARVVHDLGLD